MAVQVPAGDTTIELKYRPRGFFVGLGLLIMAVLISALIFLPQRRSWQVFAVLIPGLMRRDGAVVRGIAKTNRCLTPANDHHRNDERNHEELQPDPSHFSTELSRYSP